MGACCSKAKSSHSSTVQDISLSISELVHSSSNITVTSQGVSVEQPGQEEQPNGEPLEQTQTNTGDESTLEMKQFYDSLVQVMEKFVKIQINDLEDEEEFRVEIQNCLSEFSKSSVRFKSSELPHQQILDYQQSIARALIEHECVGRLCHLLEYSVRRLHVMKERRQSLMPFNFISVMTNIFVTLLNYSSASNEMNTEIGNHEFVFQALVEFLKCWRDLHLKQKLLVPMESYVLMSLGILNNCKTVEANVTKLREFGVDKVILPYTESPNDKIRFSAVFIMARIVSESEAESLLGINPSVFEFTLDRLKLAIQSEDGDVNEMSAGTITKAIRELALNDANKKSLVNHGCLPLLVTQIQKGINDEAVKESIESLWMLSFHKDNKVKMVNEAGLVSCVLQQSKSSEGRLKHACEGLLLSLNDEIKASDDIDRSLKQEVTTVTSVKSSKSDKSLPTGHVMISYQWDNQELIKRIAEELRKQNIPVWLDIDYMKGSTIQAMAEAVENASAIITAMSQKYKDSSNTRSEAEYAHKCSKKLIFLIMQQDYQPDGWLGFLLGSSFYYDFSGKLPFQPTMDKLMEVVKQNVTATDTARDPGDVKNWTANDVKRWLAKHNLQSLTQLSEWTGEELVFLHEIKSKAPEFFFRCLEKKIGMSSLNDLSKVSSALDDLSF